LDLTLDNGLRVGHVFLLLGGERSIAILGTDAFAIRVAFVSGEFGAVESKSNDILGLPPGTSRLSLPDEAPFNESRFKRVSCFTNEADLL
jgi:hypothetical protein